MALEQKEGVLHAYAWDADVNALAEKLRVEEDDRPAFERTFEAARANLRPCVYCRELTVDALGDDFAMLSGEWFDGPRLGRLLSESTQAWAYVATAGDSPAGPEDDLLTTWWLQKLGEDAVHAATDRLPGELPCGEAEHISAISPGSLPDWPITEQQPLFRLLGAKNVGVTLTDACLMVPRASVSGILFASPETFCSCTHCTKCQCPNRRAPADATNTNV